MDRSRDKRGHHVSVAGDPADEVLRDLVGQFTDPTAFIRELIQNSLDAGARRIDIRMAFANGLLGIDVVDDGEGMDRATIEGYLLTLFRSTKEDDLSKIGKFGIGFVSLFAMAPHRVVVDTGRDGVWHRVVFAKDHSYTLLEMPDPYEGTTVRLEVHADRQRAGELCCAIRDSASRWCQFAAAEITTAAKGASQAWPETAIAGVFHVDAPLLIRHEEDGLEVVMGPSANPVSGFYNRGLLLWEAPTALIPGVSFRAKGRHLEHTLTRDNVRRDRHFDAVMARLHQLAANELGTAVHAFLASADAAGAARLFADIVLDPPWSWQRRAALFPKSTGGHASLVDLQASGPGALRVLFGAARELLWASPGDEVASAAEAGGALVLAGRHPTDAHLHYAAALGRTNLVALHDAFRAPRPVSADRERDAQFEAANVLSAGIGLRFRVYPGRHLGDDATGARFAVAQQAPFAAERIHRDRLARGDHLVVNVDHPLFRTLGRLPPRQCGPLLLRAAMVAADVASGPVPAALLEALP